MKNLKQILKSGLIGGLVLATLAGMPKTSDAEENCRVISLPKPTFYVEGKTLYNKKLNIDSSVVDYLKWMGIKPLPSSNDHNLYDVRKTIFERVFKGMKYYGTKDQNGYFNAVLDALTLRRAPPHVQESHTGLTDEQLNLRNSVGGQLSGCN